MVIAQLLDLFRFAQLGGIGRCKFEAVYVAQANATIKMVVTSKIRIPWTRIWIRKSSLFSATAEAEVLLAVVSLLSFSGLTVGLVVVI